MATDEQTSKKQSPFSYALGALGIFLLAALIGFFLYSTTVNEETRFPFKLGLDLAGGSHLVYQADVSNIDETEVEDAMRVLRDVIERRVNVFGVSEPIVQVEQSSIVSGEVRQRLVVELPGVSDIDEAVAAIGETPLLEFKLVDASVSTVGVGAVVTTVGGGARAVASDAEAVDSGERYIDTGLTGRYVEGASLQFGQQSSGGLANEPVVLVTFNSEGGDLFETITRENVGEHLAIFLDGVVVSEPVIREAIAGGTATISGGFTPEEARDLVRNLNFGALPVPIELVSTQTIGASLGAGVLEHGVEAGMVGLALVFLFMVLWYRVPGVIASIALVFYIIMMLALFKFIPVTLTAAGLAGFILSIGMAVDANVLVFGRMKEEYEKGSDNRTAAREGFRRAWSAIRDGNMTSILSAIVLFWFGTSIVKGFALVFGLGVLLSMFTAIVVTRTLLVALPVRRDGDGSILARLYDSGFSKRKK